MARNEEKSQSMLNRFLAWKQEESGKGGGGAGRKRPWIAAECKSLAEAENWRRQLLREIGKKVTEIQNASVGEHRIRDINDEINRSIREKHHWEKRIIELGGPNYITSAPKVLDHDGREASGYGGYKYFGEARNLPGVKELLLAPGTTAPKRTRYDMYKGVDADYYGYRDDEDGILEPLEAEAEKKAIKESVAAHRDKQRRKTEAGGESDEDDGTTEFVAHVPVPTKEQVEKMIIDKRKEDLLKKYVSEELRENVVNK